MEKFMKKLKGPVEMSPEVSTLTGPDGQSEEDDVRQYFYPNLDMEEAGRILKGRPSGTFLLRPSSSSDAKYTLCIKGGRSVYNVRIFKTENGYRLDGKNQSRKHFQSISELIQYFSQTSKGLKALCTGENGKEESTALKLSYPLSKSENAINWIGERSEGGDGGQRRNVTRQGNGGSLKAMVKWL